MRAGQAIPSLAVKVILLLACVLTLAALALLRRLAVGALPLIASLLKASSSLLIKSITRPTRGTISILLVVVHTERTYGCASSGLRRNIIEGEALTADRS